MEKDRREVSLVGGAGSRSEEGQEGEPLGRGLLVETAERTRSRGEEVGECLFWAFLLSGDVFIEVWERSVIFGECL